MILKCTSNLIKEKCNACAKLDKLVLIKNRPNLTKKIIKNLALLTIKQHYAPHLFIKTKTAIRNILAHAAAQSVNFLCFVFDVENDVIILYFLCFVYQIKALIQS